MHGKIHQAALQPIHPGDFHTGGKHFVGKAPVLTGCCLAVIGPGHVEVVVQNADFQMLADRPDDKLQRLRHGGEIRVIVSE